MNHENYPQSSKTKDLNPGIIPVEEGGERAHADAPSVQGINTGEIPKIVPEDSGALTLRDEERPAFKEKLTAQREYHEQRITDTEAGWSPTGSESLTESVEQEKKKKGRLIKIGAAAAALGVALTTYFSTQSGDKSEGGPTPTQPVATADATPGKTQEAQDKVDVTKRPQSIVEQGLFNKLSPEQQAEIRQLDAMSTDEFYKLPMATQLKYAQYIYDVNVERTKYLMEQNGSEYLPLLRTVDPKPDNSGTEVWYQHQLITEVQYTLMPDQKPLDKVNAQKLMVLDITQDTAEFMHTFNTIATDKGGLLTPDNTPILAYRTDVQGNETTMKINAIVDNKLIQTTYKYTTFTDISGKERGTWQITLSVGSGNPRFDSSIK